MVCYSCMSRNPEAFCHPNHPHPASLNVWPAFPARGEAGYYIWLKCYFKRFTQEGYVYEQEDMQSQRVERG